MGRHQPPTNRSFYLSVAASTLRFALIVALVVGGIVVINQAFPEGASSGNGSGTVPEPGGPAVSVSPTPSPSESESPSANVPSPTITGTRIAVFNGTSTSGLASDVTIALEDDLYVVAQEAADAPSTVPVTTIYYRSAQDKVEAEYIANEYFKKLPDVVVAKLGDQTGTDIGREVQVAIFLGNDYAALRA
jgi:hypothetical protein